MAQTLKIAVLALLVVISIASASAAADDVQLSYNLPQAARRCTGTTFAAKYRIATSLNPFYLRGDFDGDGKVDYLIRVVSSHGKAGLLACWGDARKRAVVVGAGVPIPHSERDTFDDLPMIGWSVYDERTIERGAGEGPPPRLRGNAVFVYATESASGIIYWDGQRFRWYQQGD